MRLARRPPFPSRTASDRETCMNRTGLVIALVVGAMTGLVFGFFPRLDLKISGLLFDPQTRQFTLLYQVLLGQLSWPAHLRDASMWIVAALGYRPAWRSRPN